MTKLSLFAHGIVFVVLANRIYHRLIIPGTMKDRDNQNATVGFPVENQIISKSRRDCCEAQPIDFGMPRFPSRADSWHAEDQFERPLHFCQKLSSRFFTTLLKIRKQLNQVLLRVIVFDKSAGGHFFARFLASLRPSDAMSRQS